MGRCCFSDEAVKENLRRVLDGKDNAPGSENLLDRRGKLNRPLISSEDGSGFICPDDEIRIRGCGLYQCSISGLSGVLLCEHFEFFMPLQCLCLD